VVASKSGTARSPISQIGLKTVIGLDRARAFTAAIHDIQRREGLWLAQHPFVQAVRNGSAKRSELAWWARQIYCVTKTYGAILKSLNPPPPVGIWIDPWRDLDQLIQLGGALGVKRRDMEILEPNLETRGIQLWLQWRLMARHRHITAQVCWALMEAMSPETGTLLGKGATKHFGLKPKQLGYFRIGMRSRRSADKYAANLLTRVPLSRWNAVRKDALLVSRLMFQLYESVVDKQCSHIVGER
jgi:pyrroloquinoline quinone (PQQ) biosynthesis protein C